MAQFRDDTAFTFGACDFPLRGGYHLCRTVITFVGDYDHI